jgi:hypothetical protein
MRDARSSSRTESENKEPEEDTLGRDLRGTSTTLEERTNSTTTGNKPQRIRLQPTGASTLTGRGFKRTFTQNRREEGTRGNTLGRDSTGTTVRGTSTTSEKRTNCATSGTEPEGIKLQPR